MLYPGFVVLHGPLAKEKLYNDYGGGGGVEQLRMRLQAGLQIPFLPHC